MGRRHTPSWYSLSNQRARGGGGGSPPRSRRCWRQQRGEYGGVAAVGHLCPSPDHGVLLRPRAASLSCGAPPRSIVPLEFVADVGGQRHNNQASSFASPLQLKDTTHKHKAFWRRFLHLKPVVGIDIFTSKKLKDIVPASLIGDVGSSCESQ